MKVNVEEHIKALTKVRTHKIRQQWAEFFASPAPKNASREFMERALSHEMQVKALGGLKAATKRRLAQMATAMDRDPDYDPGPTHTPKPGTKLIRGWRGQRLEVMVLETGYAFEGRTYESLSKIATEVTGTRWSGPVFFGLKKSAAARVGV